MSMFDKQTYEVDTINPVSSSSEKDLLISHLKSKLYQLEQNEKAYADLQSQFRALQNEYKTMNEDKLRLEYELKQKTESQYKILNKLQNENENLLMN